MSTTQFGTHSSEFPEAFRRWLLENAEDNEESISRLKKNLATAIQDELTPRQQQVLQMSFLSGLSVKEIAEQLGVSSSTVTRTRQRALRRLHKALKYSF